MPRGREGGCQTAQVSKYSPNDCYNSHLIIMTLIISDSVTKLRDLQPEDKSIGQEGHNVFVSY